MSDTIKMQNDILQNIQGLIRAMDVKGGLIITISGILTASLQGISIYFFDKCYPTTHESIIVLIFACLFLLVFAYVVYQSIMTFIPRYKSLVSSDDLPDIIYPMMILHKHKNVEQYYSAINKLTDGDLVLDYAGQIIECSNIYKIKHNRIKKALYAMATLIIIWTSFVITTVIVSV